MIGDLAQKPEWDELAYYLNVTRAPFGVALAVATSLASDNGNGLALGLVERRFHPRRFLRRAGWWVTRLEPVPRRPGHPDDGPGESF